MLPLDNVHAFSEWLEAQTLHDYLVQRLAPNDSVNVLIRELRTDDKLHGAASGSEGCESSRGSGEDFSAEVTN